MEYLITPLESTNWKINQNFLIESLKKQWLNIEVKTVTNPDDYYIIEWAIALKENRGILEGALHKDLQGISLDGHIEDCATFAVWFRSLVPESQKLLFYDQNFNHHQELTLNTIKTAIIEPFLALT